MINLTIIKSIYLNFPSWVVYPKQTSNYLRFLLKIITSTKKRKIKTYSYICLPRQHIQIKTILVIQTPTPTQIKKKQLPMLWPRAKNKIYEDELRNKPDLIKFKNNKFLPTTILTVDKKKINPIPESTIQKTIPHISFLDAKINTSNQ